MCSIALSFQIQRLIEAKLQKKQKQIANKHDVVQIEPQFNSDYFE